MKKIVKFLAIFAIILISVIIIKKEDELIVCLDAGHGGHDSGAVNNTRYEKDDNLTIVKLVRKYLEEHGIKTIMTRDNDTSVSLRQRCNIANKKEADIFVSIHRNSADSGKGILDETDNELFDKNIESYAKAIADGIMEEIKDELDGR